MKRLHNLYLRIYLAFVAIGVGSLAAGALAFYFLSAFGPVPPHLHAAAQLLVESLPADPTLRGPALDVRADRLGLDLALFDAQAAWQAGSQMLPAPAPDRLDGWVHGPGGPAMFVVLDGGGWLVGRVRPRPGGPPRHVPLIVVVALAIAVGTHPLARGITRRLETLREGVDRFGQGDLDARVKPEGHDEVAALAVAFNRSADRIQALIEGQRRMLASASHELRSPLARLRLSVELLVDSQEDREQRRDDAIRDIAELDRLIDDLLLAGRLESGRSLRLVSVDLLGLVATELARMAPDCALEGQPVEIQGDPALLRMMVRNLLENAQRYGLPPFRAIVGSVSGAARLVIEDNGRGVPEAERERVFEPFYRPQGSPEGEGGGAGLGLAIVRRVAGLHGGCVCCEAAEGGGARFVVEIPGASSSLRTTSHRGWLFAGHEEGR